MGTSSSMGRSKSPGRSSTKSRNPISLVPSPGEDTIDTQQDHVSEDHVSEEQNEVLSLHMQPASQSSSQGDTGTEI